MPVDPFGSGDYHSPDEGIWFGDGGYDDSPSWRDLIQDAIYQGAQTAQIYGAGYPQGSTNIYAPQYPQTQQAPAPLPYPAPSGLPAPVPQPSGGIQLSTTTLMLLVGGVLLFMLGTKKGR